MMCVLGPPQILNPAANVDPLQRMERGRYGVEVYETERTSFVSSAVIYMILCGRSDDVGDTRLQYVDSSERGVE